LSHQIGERVGAISHTDENIVYLYGFGIYDGEHIPPKDAGGFNVGRPNPRIKLDNGKTVYGCECWWGAEEQVKAQINGMEIVFVDGHDEN